VLKREPPVSSFVEVAPSDLRRHTSGSFGGRNAGISGDVDRGGYTAAASGLTDHTQSTTNPTTANLSYGPCAIIVKTRRLTLFIAGDSKNNGTGESNAAQDPAGSKGETERSVGREFAYINASTAGDRIETAAAGYALRLALSQYCSHVTENYGINDKDQGLVPRSSPICRLGLRSLGASRFSPRRSPLTRRPPTVGPRWKIRQSFPLREKRAAST